MQGGGYTGAAWSLLLVRRGGVMCVGGSHTRGGMGVNAHGSSVTRFRHMCVWGAVIQGGKWGSMHMAPVSLASHACVPLSSARDIVTHSVLGVNVRSGSQKVLNLLEIASCASPDEISVLGVARFDGL